MRLDRSHTKNENSYMIKVGAGFPRPASSFPGFKKTVGSFRGINSDYLCMKLHRWGDHLGALKTPFFCLLTHFLPLSHPFSTACRPIFYRLPTLFLLLLLKDAFFGTRYFFLLPRGPGREFIFSRKINFPEPFNDLI